MKITLSFCGNETSSRFRTKNDLFWSHTMTRNMIKPQLTGRISMEEKRRESAMKRHKSYIDKRRKRGRESKYDDFHIPPEPKSKKTKLKSNIKSDSHHSRTTRKKPKFKRSAEKDTRMQRATLKVNRQYQSRRKRGKVWYTFPKMPEHRRALDSPFGNFFNPCTVWLCSLIDCMSTESVSETV